MKLKDILRGERNTQPASDHTETIETSPATSPEDTAADIPSSEETPSSDESINAVISPVDEQKPDNILELDVSMVKTLQIGYQAETIFLLPAKGDKLILEEYINLTGSEYFAKVTANRIKTTIRYGRREEVNTKTYVKVYLPETYKGELLLSTQYGNISTDSNWSVDRFAAETSEGIITLKTIEAPRIRILSSVSPIQIEHAIGFTDIHSVSGAIIAKCIDGGAKLETSSAPIFAHFNSLNNILECNTLNGDITLELPSDAGMNIDGISKTGEIQSELSGLTLKIKPGNIKNIMGVLGTKPFQNVRLSTINGNINLQ